MTIKRPTLVATSVVRGIAFNGDEILIAAIRWRLRYRFVAGGSSPSTISLYDFESNQKVGSVNLTMDIRNAIHGLEPWPYPQ